MQTQAAPTVIKLDRGMGLAGAMSANILNMVGVGPFLTIPLALAAMGGPQAMLGWLAGALLCLCDGMVWAELGSELPQSGGPYHYLLQAFGPTGWGRLISFLFLWQTLLIGPISIASGAVGFGEYASFLAPRLPHWQLVILAFSFPPHAFTPSRAFWMGLGSATLIATYDYGGYNNVCFLGEEVKAPKRTIPLAVIGSIVLVAILYLAMNLSILGTIPWQQGQHSRAIVADYMQALYGRRSGVFVSVLVLVASWGSVFAILLGFSRIPYTAAADGHFFKVFAHLHPTGKFPSISLLAMGGLSVLACLFSLPDLISVLIVVQTMTQFAAQCVAVILLRRRAFATPDSFRMPLFPLPAVIALLGWLYIVLSSNPLHIAIGAAMALTGACAYLLLARSKQEWPFKVPDEA